MQILNIQKKKLSLWNENFHPSFSRFQLSWHDTIDNRITVHGSNSSCSSSIIIIIHIYRYTGINHQTLKLQVNQHTYNNSKQKSNTQLASIVNAKWSFRKYNIWSNITCHIWLNITYMKVYLSFVRSLNPYNHIANCGTMNVLSEISYMTIKGKHGTRGDVAAVVVVVQNVCVHVDVCIAV